MLAVEMSEGLKSLISLWIAVALFGCCLGAYFLFFEKDLKKGLLVIGSLTALPLTLAAAIVFTILFTLSVIALELPTMYLVARRKFRAQLEAISEETD